MGYLAMANLDEGNAIGSNGSKKAVCAIHQQLSNSNIVKMHTAVDALHVHRQFLSGMVDQSQWSHKGAHLAPQLRVSINTGNVICFSHDYDIKGFDGW
jgi:hypothetical protein